MSGETLSYIDLIITINCIGTLNNMSTNAESLKMSKQYHEKNIKILTEILNELKLIKEKYELPNTTINTSFR